MNPPERPASLEAAAKEFLLDPDVAFLNFGSYGATPRPVLDAQTRLRERMEANPVRFLMRELPERLATARDACAAFLGADPDGFAFVANATTGVNTVVRSLGLRQGDEVVTTDHAYPAVTHTLRRLCERHGARLVLARVPLPLPEADAIRASVRDACTERTRLIVVDQITSRSGCLLPVEDVIADANGIPVLVDGAHVPGQLDVSLDALGADFWTGNFHKWVCAPKGSAALWVSERWRERIEAPVTSLPTLTMLVDRLGYQGTNDPTAYLATPAAIEWLRDVGIGEIQAYGRALARWGRTRLADALGMPVAVPDEAMLQMGIVELPGSPGMTVEEGLALNRRLHDEHRVEVPISPLVGRGWLRISAHCFTTPEQIERLVEALGVVLG